MLKSSLQTLYSRHNEKVNSYELSISQLAMDRFAYTQLFFPLSLTGVIPKLHVRNTACVLQEAGIAYSPGFFLRPMFCFQCACVSGLFIFHCPIGFI